MSGSALKSPSPINLDEFERRLRAAGSNTSAAEDPLDELARLVGLDVGASEAAVPAAAAEAVKPPGLRLPQAAPMRVPPAPPARAAQLPRVAPMELKAPSPRPSEPVAEVSHEEDAAQGEPETLVEEHHEPMQFEDSEPAQPRSARAKWTLAALVALGAAGFVTAWAMKGTPGLPRNPPMIMAAEGPTKVQPPSQDTVASAGDSASVVLKEPAGQQTPVKVVSHVEQPVDLQQQPSPPAPVAAANPPAATSPAPAPAPAVTSVGSTAAAPLPPVTFPEPKRVRTVSVRPDGSVISSDSAPAPAAVAPPPIAAAPPVVVADAAPASASAVDAGSPAIVAESTIPQPAHAPVPVPRPSFANDADGAQAATPKVNLPTKLSGKSTTRVSTAKLDTTVAGGGDRAAELPQASAAGAADSVGKAPRDKVAEAEPTATSSTAKPDGAYAVQLAAPGTEEEAQSAAGRLRTKYTNELGGQQTSIHHAEVNGRNIYRVRVVGLSKPDAIALCAKLKATGGEAACFVTKN